MEDQKSTLNDAHSMCIIVPEDGKTLVFNRSKPMVVEKKYTRRKLRNMGVRELVVIAREMKVGGAWMTGAQKEELINAIVRGAPPITPPPELVHAMSILVSGFADMVQAELKRREDHP